MDCEKCHKVYCQKCVLSLKKCSLCQTEPFVLKPNHNVRQFTSNLKVECENDGCFEKPTRSNLEAHLEKCPFSLVPCTSDGCEQKVKRVDLNQHLIATCDFVESACANPGCLLMFNRLSMPSHLKVCRFAFTTCPVCHLGSARSKVLCHIIEQHYEDYGPKFLPIIE